MVQIKSGKSAAQRLLESFRGGTEDNPGTMTDPNLVSSEMSHIGGNPGAALAHLLERGGASGLFPDASPLPPESQLPPGGGASGGAGASDIIGIGAPRSHMVMPNPTEEKDIHDTFDRADSGRASVSYTVRPGDTLIGIAKKVLGDPLKFAKLYKLNQDVIGENPNLIRPGQKLRVPEEDRIG